MRASTSLAFPLVLLAACKSDPPAQRSNRRPTAAPTRSAPAAPDASPLPVGATAANAVTDDAAAPAAPPVEEGVRAFRVADSTCVRDPARNSLGIGVHGYFGGGRLEIEVRNVRYSCTPAPTYAATFEDGVVHLRVPAPDRAALGRCQCRHDQFLQVTGVPQGDYTVQVEQLGAGDAGDVTVLGSGTIVASVPTPAATATATTGSAP